MTISRQERKQLRAAAGRVEIPGRLVGPAALAAGLASARRAIATRFAARRLRVQLGRWVSTIFATQRDPVDSAPRLLSALRPAPPANARPRDRRSLLPPLIVGNQIKILKILDHAH